MRRLGFKIFLLASFAMRKLQQCLPIQIAIRIQNAFSHAIKGKVEFSYDETLELYQAKEKNAGVFFVDQLRGFSLYERGVQKRGFDLLRNYCLESVEFEKGDIIVDCGANYGDLFLGLKDVIPQENYFAFEPSVTEFKTLQRNYPKAKLFNIALGAFDGEVQFFVSTQNADSSVIKPKAYSDVVTVDQRKLDNMQKHIGALKCKLLKIEAEGAEPEVLLGAKKFLGICQFVAVDGGAERGQTEEVTMPAVSKILHEHGFVLMRTNPIQHRALFARRSL